MENENTKNIKMTIGTSSTEVVKEIPNGMFRKVLHIQNTSTAGQRITIAFGQEAVLDAGETMWVGGYHDESVDNGFIPWQNFVHAISSDVGGQVSIHERVVPEKVSMRR